MNEQRKLNGHFHWFNVINLMNKTRAHITKSNNWCFARKKRANQRHYTAKDYWNESCTVLIELIRMCFVNKRDLYLFCTGWSTSQRWLDKCFCRLFPVRLLQTKEVVQSSFKADNLGQWRNSSAHQIKWVINISCEYKVSLFARAKEHSVWLIY